MIFYANDNNIITLSATMLFEKCNTKSNSAKYSDTKQAIMLVRHVFYGLWHFSFELSNIFMLLTEIFTHIQSVTVGKFSSLLTIFSTRITRELHRHHSIATRKFPIDKTYAKVMCI